MIEFIGPLYNVTTVHKSLSDTLSSSDWTLNWNYCTPPILILVLTHLSFSFCTYNSPARTPRKTPSSVYQESVFIGPLPRNGCHIVESVCFGNVFTEALPSSGHMRHTKRFGGKDVENCQNMFLLHDNACPHNGGFYEGDVCSSGLGNHEPHSLQR
jgi:hypothetical protein